MRPRWVWNPKPGGWLVGLLIAFGGIVYCLVMEEISK